LHEVYVAVMLVAAVTLALALFYPAGFSPTRPAGRSAAGKAAS
jgi:hypothetical protein